jgi:hypothetical protein
VGKVIGVGPGRGIALMLLSLAALPAIAAVRGLLNPRLRNLESELPDAPRVAKTAPPPQETPAAEAPAGTAAADAAAQQA